VANNGLQSVALLERLTQVIAPLGRDRMILGASVGFDSLCRLRRFFGLVPIRRLGWRRRLAQRSMTRLSATGIKHFASALTPRSGARQRASVPPSST